MSHSKVILPPKPQQFISKQQLQVNSNLFPLRRIQKPSTPTSIFVYVVNIEAEKPKVRKWDDNLRVLRFFLVCTLSLDLVRALMTTNRSMRSLMEKRVHTMAKLCFTALKSCHLTMKSRLVASALYLLISRWLIDRLQFTNSW